MPTLQEYEIFSRFSNTHQKEMNYLKGKVYDDERFPNGSEIETSAIIDYVDGLMATTTKGTIYFLKNKKKNENMELTKERVKEAFEKAAKEVIKGEFLNKDGGEKLNPMSRMMMSLSGIVFVKEVEKMVFEELGIERDK